MNETIELEILDLYDLMIEQLRDLYDAEIQQLELFPELEKLASSLELQEVIAQHQRETKRQLDRLETVFGILEEEPQGERCEGIEGIIRETLKLSRRCRNAEVCDAGLITSIQHINHYEMASYGTAVSYAKKLDRHDVAELLLASLREEKNVDWGLSDLAEGQINTDAIWTFLIKKIRTVDRSGSES